MNKQISNNAESRKQFILQCLEKNEYSDVVYLSQVLGVSEMTIRRDLEKLEGDEQLLRVHGGARSLKKEMYEAPLSNRLFVNFDEKRKIGNYCSNLIEDGDVIALDASSTALALAKQITVSVTVVTNNISIVQELSSKDNIEIILLGGAVRKSSCSTVGLDMVQMTQKYYVDKLFLSSKSVDMEYGISDATPQEGEAKKAMINSSREIYLMMDYTKLGTRAFYNVCKTESVHCIISNYMEEYNENQSEFIEQCKRNKIDLRFAK